jgi:predicted glycosyltransferase
MRRIAFYSYDERGLGHVRRSIAIAHAFSAARPSSILLIAGAREAALFTLLASRPRALVVPRAEPAEQGIRARRLAARGAFDMLEPEALTPSALTAWLAAGTSRRTPGTPAAPVDTAGLQRLPALLDELLTPGRSGRDRRFQRPGERAAARTGGVPA